MSSGSSSSCSSEAFAKVVRTSMGPFLRKAFPGRVNFRVLLDGEKVALLVS